MKATYSMIVTYSTIVILPTVADRLTVTYSWIVTEIFNKYKVLRDQTVLTVTVTDSILETDSI